MPSRSRCHAFRQIALHRAVLEALTARPPTRADPARLAHHAEEAGGLERGRDRGDAGGRARGRARRPPGGRPAVPAGAAARRRALDDRQRADLLGRLAYECYLTDLSTEALAAREEELRIRTAQPGTWRGWATCTAGCHGCTGGRAAASRPSATPRSPSRRWRRPSRSELAMAYSNRAQLCMLRGDLAGTRHVERALLRGAVAAAAERAGDRSRRARAEQSGHRGVSAGEARRRAGGCSRPAWSGR